MGRGAFVDSRVSLRSQDCRRSAFSPVVPLGPTDQFLRIVLCVQYKRVASRNEVSQLLNLMRDCDPAGWFGRTLAR